MFILLARDGVNHIIYPIYMKNNLWFHYMYPNINKSNSTFKGLVINALNVNKIYELWHHRLGYPGKKITDKLHHHTIGVPILRHNPFLVCSSCLHSKFHNRSIKRDVQISTVRRPTKHKNKPQPSDSQCLTGQHVHMDYGSVRGSDWQKKDNEGKLVTSIDKYRSYLLVID